MAVLRFFSRIVFLFNLAFLFTLLLQYKSFVKDGSTTSTIVVAGYLVAPFLNIILNIITGILYLLRRPVHRHVPRWLLLANFIILLVQFSRIFLVI